MKNHIQELYLGKFIAQAGIASRRKAIEEIKKGLVAVNGKITVNPAYIVQKDDLVTYKGHVVEQEKHMYILLNKPKGYIASTSDERGRNTVMDLLPKNTLRLFPIGRLDRNTTGLIVITNDGAFAQTLAHPRSCTPKIYHVTLDRPFTAFDLETLSRGIRLFDGLIKPDYVGIKPASKKYDVIIELHSGKNRIIRRIFEHLDYKIKKLDRSQYAGLTKKNLPSGTWRHLTAQEVTQLKHMDSQISSEKKKNQPVAKQIKKTRSTQNSIKTIKKTPMTR
jgi:23S rRNA pseudouridine2605 synthase